MAENGLLWALLAASALVTVTSVRLVASRKMVNDWVRSVASMACMCVLSLLLVAWGHFGDGEYVVPEVRRGSRAPQRRPR